MIEPKLFDYFRLARERYRIMLLKESGAPWPWTEDPILQNHRFTCVHREDDKTTRWYATNIREPLRGNPAELIMATAAFRWFNRISTGELLLDLLVGEWDSTEALARLRVAGGPPCTGAYIVVGERGYPKAEGVLLSIDRFRDRVDPEVLENAETLEDAHRYLRGVPYLGGFTAYELVSDLRWSVLQHASDIGEWAHIGPGATRGLGDLLGRQFTQARDQKEMLGHLRSILQASRDERFWPARWRPWEMREVEHWLCEFSKYNAAARGARLKRRYKPPE